jgi:hypothetical protein
LRKLGSALLAILLGRELMEKSEVENNGGGAIEELAHPVVIRVQEESLVEYRWLVGACSANFHPRKTNTCMEYGRYTCPNLLWCVDMGNDLAPSQRTCTLSYC